MTEGMELARENLREYIDKLMDQGYTIRDGQSPDPELIDPGGSADVEGHPGVLDDAEHKAVLATLARRDWLDQAITVMAAES